MAHYSVSVMGMPLQGSVLFDQVRKVLQEIGIDENAYYSGHRV